MLSQNSEEKFARMMNYILAETGDKKLAKAEAAKAVKPSAALIQDRLRNRNRI